MHKLLNMIYEVENNGQMSHSSAIDMYKIHKLANLCVCVCVLERVRSCNSTKFTNKNEGAGKGGDS